MRATRRIPIPVTLLSICLVAAACVAEEEPSADVEAGTVAAGLAEGTYVHPSAQADPTALRSGEQIEFAGGRHTVRLDDEAMVEGRYTVEGDRITLTDERGLWICGPEERTATYTYTASGDRLTFAPVGEDPCEGRREGLTREPWVRGEAETPPEVDVPDALRSSWDAFWVDDDSPTWADRLFTRDATVVFQDSTYEGLERIKSGWLPSIAGSEDVTPHPFTFSGSGDQMTERGRYTVRVNPPEGEPFDARGRYEITWMRQSDGSWKVGRLHVV